MYIFSEKELKENVVLDDDVITAIEEGFASLAKGNATVPPIMMIPIPDLQAEVDVKAAHIKGLDSLAVKIASGFFQNDRLGLPTSSGLMIVLSAKTGFPEAILLDNGYLTHVRTGAAGAVAAKYLAPEDTTDVGVIGTGTQARFQMRGLKKVRDFSVIHLYSLDSEEVIEKYIKEISEELKVKVLKAESVEEVVRMCSVVVTTTPSRKPYLKAEWLHPGLHITAMGSDTEEKQELFPEVLKSADVLACDLKSQCFRLGELRSGLQAGIISPDYNIVELGELIIGSRKGRTSDSQITVCDLTGVGVQDTEIALQAVKKAKEKGAGTKIAFN
ncbi:MAG: cyclodeaminase [Spirochaetes bacterium]|nr:MAG: cyclodeaminase [Spirochaetota bacterium]